jgi:hypothetical protein
MKALVRLRFGLAMLLVLTPLAGCLSSSGGGGSKPSTTYIVVPAGSTSVPAGATQVPAQ